MPKRIQNTANDTIGVFIDAWRRERPDLDPWPLGILGRVQRISARLIRATEELLGPMQLTWEAFSLIVSLRRAGKPYAMRPTEIYRQSLITSGAATNRIDRVSELGLVRRVRDLNDRRGIAVELTAKGKAVADRAIEMQFAMLEEAFSALSPAERRQLTTLLAKLLSSLEAKDSSSRSVDQESKRKQRAAFAEAAS
jgi:DNA-binding MarR family transcriptional regulator